MPVIATARPPHHQRLPQALLPRGIPCSGCLPQLLQPYRAPLPPVTATRTRSELALAQAGAQEACYGAARGKALRQRLYLRVCWLPRRESCQQLVDPERQHRLPSENPPQLLCFQLECRFLSIFKSYSRLSHEKIWIQLDIHVDSPPVLAPLWRCQSLRKPQVNRVDRRKMGVIKAHK